MTIDDSYLQVITVVFSKLSFAGSTLLSEFIDWDCAIKKHALFSLLISLFYCYLY